jgi:hypothetical protein
MTFEEEKLESAKLGMILDWAIPKRGYILIHQRDSGDTGVICANTPQVVIPSILRNLATLIEERSDLVEFHGRREYPGSEQKQDEALDRQSGNQ